MLSKKIKDILPTLSTTQSAVLSNLSDGAIPLVLSSLLNQLESLHNSPQEIIFLANDSSRITELESSFSFFAPSIEIVHLAAWDCLPYDRVSPSTSSLSKRLYGLCSLASTEIERSKLIILTPSSLLQRVPPMSSLSGHSRTFVAGQSSDMQEVIDWLSSQGFDRVSNVQDGGEYAVRGSILDLFPPGYLSPIRLDYFGERLESLRVFDAATQRTQSQLRDLTLSPMNEVPLDSKSISRFRTNYLSTFGAADSQDLLYHAVSDGRRYSGLEHYLPLFFDHLATLFDYFAARPIVIDHLALPALSSRYDQILDHHQSRVRGDEDYKALDPEKLYLTPTEVTNILSQKSTLHISPFSLSDDTLESPQSSSTSISLDIGPSHNFSRARGEKLGLFESVLSHINSFHSRNIKVLIACWSEGSRERLSQILQEHGLTNLTSISDWSQFESLSLSQVGLAIIGLESGFASSDFAIISEQDILGDRLTKRRIKSRMTDAIVDLSTLSSGDYVVHLEHGVAKFAGLVSVESDGSVHDCLDLRYWGDDKLFLPVENIDLLSKYGASQTDIVADKLGSGHWQARKAKAKKHILAIASDLISVAAQRELRKVPSIPLPDLSYDEFSARFPYDETDDQRQAIEDVISDLASTKPMDRLICGDVGFGKTEVALRAAFIVAMSGKQVAIVVPTTLLSRQHYATFKDRFADFPIRVSQASRLVGQSELSRVKESVSTGDVDIVIGTHSLLGSSISFKDLGLLIIDEEQHFGVKHKERLKSLKEDVHVLTLSATPIPRTLQLSLSGVRDLSLITTPPQDRMSVRTFVSSFDKVTIRQALLRERYRGGRSFYVCPRISDLPSRAEFLAESVPELKVAVAHAQLSPAALEDIMVSFYEGKYDVLLSTTIIESGLDIPSANTLIVHRADMFGLSQLYQLRGRVGRSKVRAYAFMTLSPNHVLTASAQKRLKVLVSLNSLGSGFQLASHDLDIRGAGNILGEEQSGHVKEVGYELYQQMLEEAVMYARYRSLNPDESIDKQPLASESWSPQLSLGVPVSIPESYVPDLPLRMSLYRRLGDLSTKDEIDSFAAELLDRFGVPLPSEIDNLLRIVLIKSHCRTANIERIDAGKRGLSIHFRDSTFSNVDSLITWIGEQGNTAQIRPDQSLVLQRDFSAPSTRLSGVESVVSHLSSLVQ